MLASEFGKPEVVEVILSRYEKLKIDLSNEYEYTALILAAENGHKECVDLLIGNGANLNLSNKFGKTALVMAAENGHYDIVFSLCQNEETDLNQTSKRGVSALMLAAVKGHGLIVKCLTDHQADITIQNNDKVGDSTVSLSIFVLFIHFYHVTLLHILPFSIFLSRRFPRFFIYPVLHKTK